MGFQDLSAHLETLLSEGEPTEDSRGMGHRAPLVPRFRTIHVSYPVFVCGQISLWTGVWVLSRWSWTTPAASKVSCLWTMIFWG